MKIAKPDIRDLSPPSSTARRAENFCAWGTHTSSRICAFHQAIVSSCLKATGKASMAFGLINSGESSFVGSRVMPLRFKLWITTSDAAGRM